MGIVLLCPLTWRKENRKNAPDFTFADFSLLEIDDGYFLWIDEFLVSSELFYLCGSSSHRPPNSSPQIHTAEPTLGVRSLRPVLVILPRGGPQGWH